MIFPEIFEIWPNILWEYFSGKRVRTSSPRIIIGAILGFTREDRFERRFTRKVS